LVSKTDPKDVAVRRDIPSIGDGAGLSRRFNERESGVFGTTAVNAVGMRKVVNKSEDECMMCDGRSNEGGFSGEEG